MTLKRTALFVALSAMASAAIGGVTTDPTGTTLEKTIARGTMFGAGPNYKYLVEKSGELFYAQSLFPKPPYPFLSVNPGIENPLIAFAQMSDFQIMDDESPLRVPFTDKFASDWGTGSAYRPQEMLSTHMADAAVRSVRKVGKGPATHLPLKFALLTGDNVDNMQFNETRWYIDVLDGGMIYPKSHTGGEESVGRHMNWPYWTPDYYSVGAYSSFPNLYTQTGGSFFNLARAPYRATGLGMPWYTAMGNHDRMIQGNMPLHPTFLGEFDIGADSAEGFFQDFATSSTWIEDLRGVQPGLTKWEAVKGVLKNRIGIDYGTPHTADPYRYLLNRADYIAEHFDTTGSPAGHGFAPGQTVGYYAIPSGPDDVFKFIALDTNESEEFGSEGHIGNTQMAWLENQLKLASSRYRSSTDTSVFMTQPWVKDKLIVLYAHHMIEDIDKAGDSSGTAGEKLEKLLLRFPNVIMFVNGHSHGNAIKPHRISYGGGDGSNRNGFWEINTASVLDWPMQSRIIEVASSSDQLKIITTMVDLDAPVNPGATTDELGAGTPRLTANLASLGRQLGANDPQEIEKLDRRRGNADSRNAVLVMPAPFTIVGGGAPVSRFVGAVDHTTRAVAFTSRATDSDGRIVAWNWDFGDGTTSTEANPRKTFDRYGTYNVTLKVTDDLGYENSATNSIELRNPYGVAELQNGVATTAWRRVVVNRVGTIVVPARYSIFVPRGTPNLSVTTSNLQLGTNADLYLKLEGLPTATNYTCRSVRSDSNETCGIANPTPGYWYVEVVPAGTPPGIDPPPADEGPIPSELLKQIKVDLKASY
jgi:metallophosphoesterase (TIGR03767 family)